MPTSLCPACTAVVSSLWRRRPARRS